MRFRMLVAMALVLASNVAHAGISTSPSMPLPFWVTLMGWFGF